MLFLKNKNKKTLHRHPCALWTDCSPGEHWVVVASRRELCRGLRAVNSGAERQEPPTGAAERKREKQLQTADLKKHPQPQKHVAWPAGSLPCLGLLFPQGGCVCAGAWGGCVSFDTSGTRALCCRCMEHEAHGAPHALRCSYRRAPQRSIL